MNITIVGTGYVGLVSGACFAEMGIDVTCVDVDNAKIEQLRRGVMPIYEPGLAELVVRNSKAGRLHFTTSLTEALRDAELQIEDIDYINAHGTSTNLGDVAELKAIQGLFGEHAYAMNISSTKSMTGHLLGGTAAIEALACVMAITRGIIPPTINVEQVDAEIDPKLNLTLHKAQHREVRCALSNTFGFGGHNSSIIFRKL